MTSFGSIPPSPPPPLAPAPLAYAVPVVKPATPKVLGILGIIFACISLLNHTIGLAMVVPGLVGGEISTLSTLQPAITVYWPMIDSVVSAGLSLLLLMASVNVLRWIAAGRRSMLTWARLHLAWLFIHGVIYLVFVAPAQLDVQFRSQPGLQSSAARSAAYVAAYVVAAITLAVIAVLPILVLVFMNKPHVREAFEGAARTPPGNPRIPPASTPGR